MVFIEIIVLLVHECLVRAMCDKVYDKMEMIITSSRSDGLISMNANGLSSMNARHIICIFTILFILNHPIIIS